jgi:hypothetical protein
MKSNILSFAVIGFLASVVLIGCQNPGEKRLQEQKKDRAESKADVKTDNDKYSDEWLTFKIESEIEIQVNEEKIAAFKERMEKTGSKIKTNYDKELSNLEETNKELEKTLVNYKNGGGNAWNDFKTGFNNELDKLDKAVNNLTADNSEQNLKP